MPAIETDGSAFQDEGALAEEQAKVEQAKAELMDEEPQERGYLGGKYQSVEDLENGYKAMQAEYTRLKEEVNQAAVEESDDGEEEDGSPQITDEQVDQIRTAMFDQVGGEAKYRGLTEWAAKNISEERQQAYDNALRSADQTQIMQALKSIQYDHMMSTGYEPKLTGGGAPSMEIRGFQSEAQVVEAMRDPRYSGPNADPAYIREVEQKMAANPNLFATR